ncbi:MAG: hypothetical protein C0405_00930 [Desulfovibrio sp.]|nr:hypothetical protein [Desulfovibrio sp.]
MMLYFPHLHPALLADAQRQALPQGVRFLDPGLAEPGSQDHVPPACAPFDRRLARAILADTLRFGESVAAPRDIAVQGLLQQAEALSPESARLVLATVESSIAGTQAKPGALPEPLLEARRQAQTLLLLAWNLEERILDLRGIDAGLRASWKRLGESVAQAEATDEAALAAQSGLEDDESAGQADGDALALGKVLAGLTPPDAYVEALPWRRILEAFVALAPGAELVTADASIVSALREACLPESQGAFAAPAWKLAGLDRCPPARPWLDTMVRLTCVVPAADPVIDPTQGAA